VSSIIRLGTQYGGGKTHSLIALVHAVRGMKGVPNPETFVDPAILPAGAIRIAALDGENADPANGLTLEPGLLARSLWGEMAYRLAGRAGYERVRVSDERHIAPGVDTIRELFGGQPTLILLDEISVYLRKVERAFPDASKQFAAFIHDLFKAVASTPQVALVYTLAIGKDDKAGDAYKEENERAAAAMAEAESVAVRSTTPLNPNGSLGHVSEECMLDTLHWAAKTAREQNTGAAQSLIENAHLSGDPTLLTALEALLNVLPPGIASAGKKKPDANLTGAANDFEALERLRKLAFSETVPAPKIPEQLPLALEPGEQIEEEDE
jgi:hypothetical protein